MSWVEPFFTCGECGGQIGRWPMTNILRQEILDWRHHRPPIGVAPHRAILGTKAHTPRIPARTADHVDEADAPDPVPPPEMPARPALHDDLPGPALSLDRTADANGWTVQAWIMRGTLMDVRWKAMRVITSVVLWLDRDGVRLIATWRTKTEKEDVGLEWEFDAAWMLGHHLTPLTGPELKAAVKFPQTSCDTCGENAQLHVSTNAGLLCFNDWVALTATPTEEVAP